MGFNSGFKGLIMYVGSDIVTEGI